MSEYGKKLLELHSQMNKRISLEEALTQLNRQKAQAEGILESVEQQLDKAIRKVDKLERKGIFSLFASQEKYDIAYSEMSALKTEYSNAKMRLERINRDIQKIFNQMAGFSDAERLYNTLMAEVNTALANGNSDIITEDELKLIQKEQIRAKINQLEKAITRGADLIDMIDGYLHQYDSILSASFPEESLRIATNKFRTALKDTEKSTLVSLETESNKRVPNFLYGYDPLGRDRYHDRLPLEMTKGISAEELLENLAELAHNTQQIVKDIEKEIQHLKDLI